MRLEFGNPEHIKLVAEGYAIGKAITDNIEAELVYDCEDCEECGGSGQTEIYICSNCDNSGNNPDQVVYSESRVKYDELDHELIGRCMSCKAKLNNN